MNTKSVSRKYDQPGGGCGGVGGCLGIGCLVIFLLIATAGIGGYFSLMHTNMPLQFVESAIESSGEVEIEGLDGTLSSGFSAKEFRFKTTNDKWSTLNDINFKYESRSSFFSGDKFTIDDISIASGKIYASWDPESQQIDLTPDFDTTDEDIDVVFSEASSGEFLIKNISVENLEIINTHTDTSTTVDNASLTDFHFKDGKLMNFGELNVSSSQLDLTTASASDFDDTQGVDISSRFQGTIKTKADIRLAKNIPFTVDYGVSDDMETAYFTAKFMDGAMVVSDLPEGSSVDYMNLALADYVGEEVDFVAPTNIDFKLVFDKHDEVIEEVAGKKTLALGETTFSNVRLATSEPSNQLICDASINGQPVTLTFFVRSAYSPWENMQLTSSAFQSDEDLWAQTCFTKSFDDLSPLQQQKIENAVGTKTIEESTPDNDVNDDENPASKSETASDREDLPNDNVEENQ